jgi:Zn-finger nucleic acid-binding protein
MIFRSTDGQCPRCLEPLLEPRQVRRADGECPRCCGVLVGLEKVRAMYREVAVACGRNVYMPDLMEHEYGDPARPCPVCNDRMMRVWFDSLPLDACPEHGVWFDSGELDILLAFAAKPAKMQKPRAVR